MRDLAELHACPVDGCLIFPYDREDELADHVASGAHVFEITTRATVKVPGENVDRPDHHGNGTSTGGRPSNLASEKQVDLILRLLDEKDFPFADLVAASGLTEAISADGDPAVLVPKFSKKGASAAIDLLFGAARKATDVDEYRWTKVDGIWMVRGPKGALGKTITISKADGTTAEAIVEGEKAPGLYVVRKVEKVQVGRVGLVAEAGKVYRRADGEVVLAVEGRESGRLYGKVLDPEAKKFVYADQALRDLVEVLTLEEAKAFGIETGVCCVCGRELRKKASIEAGIGPVCASKYGG